MTCTKCDGTGKHESYDCPICEGYGTVMEPQIDREVELPDDAKFTDYRKVGRG